MGRPQLPPETIGRARELRRAGLTTAAIGEALGISQGAAWKCTRDLGKVHPPRTTIGASVDVPTDIAIRTIMEREGEDFSSVVRRLLEIGLREVAP